MNDFNNYLDKKIIENNPIINENIEIKKNKIFENILEYNYYLDKKISLLKLLGGNDESI